MWKRPDLSARDRSVVTVAALIARNQVAEMPYYFNLALDAGIKPAEMSENLTHLAFYSGFSNSTAALIVLKDIFVQRRIGPDELPAAFAELLPIDRAAEEKRASRVQHDVGPVSQPLVRCSGDLLFKDLWLRPALAPRDRSLVTASGI